MSKPTILLVPGAFAKPSCYDKLTPLLTSEGYQTVAAPLLSVDPTDAASCSCTIDAEHIKTQHLIPLIEDQGKDVIVFAHSYGALCAGIAVDGLARSVRHDTGRKGGVLGLIYLAGTMVPENKYIMELLGESWPPFFKIDHPRLGCAVIDPVIETLYEDADPTDHAALEASMTPHAYATFRTKSSKPGASAIAYRNRRVFIRTAHDKCQPPQAQDMYMNLSGVEWKVEDLDASHGAFWTRPEDVARIITKYASEW
ncbi:MAG: hypothetical protein Q9159_002264 [Coniocarpon cinnabarinum]